MRKRWTLLILAAGLATGALAGVGGYTFIYARGASYLTSDPAACANCHIMQDHYDAWTRSSHHAVAVCNDCHAPHDLLGKYAIKGINGFNHSLAFTTGRFHEPIGITAMNRRVTENACRHCHADIVSQIDTVHANAAAEDPGRMSCLRCHSEVGHME